MLGICLKFRQNPHNLRRLTSLQTWPPEQNPAPDTVLAADSRWESCGLWTCGNCRDCTCSALTTLHTEKAWLRQVDKQVTDCNCNFEEQEKNCNYHCIKSTCNLEKIICRLLALLFRCNWVKIYILFQKEQLQVVKAKRAWCHKLYAKLYNINKT